MTKRQIIHFNALSRALLFLIEIEAILNQISLYPPLKTRFIELYDKIYDAMLLQSKQIHPLTVDKGILEKIMIATVFLYQLRAKVQAFVLNKTELYNSFKKPKTFLSSGGDQQNLGRCIVMKDLMANNNQILTEITDAIITEMENAIQKFDDSINTPQKAIKDRKSAATDSIPVLIKEIDEVKSLIGNLIWSYLPDKSKKWQSEVKIGKPTGVRHKSIIFRFLDDATGVPLSKVNVAITNGIKTYKIKSSRRGYIRLASLPTDNYTLTAQHPVYETQHKTNLGITKGKIVKLEIKLKKLPL